MQARVVGGRHVWSAAAARRRGGAARGFSSVNAGRGVAGGAQALRVHDVTARDGIQNEKTVLSVAQKADLVRNLVAMGPSSVEVCSFVREDYVPAMAGAAALCAQLLMADWAVAARRCGMGFAALVPNMHGYKSFLRASGAAAGLEGHARALDTVVVLVSCTDSHSRANVKMPLEKALDVACEIASAARADGFQVRAYASMAFLCPFEGAVAPDAVLRIVERFAQVDERAPAAPALAPTLVCLADTLGRAEVESVHALLPAVIAMLGSPDRVGLHLHNAHGLATRNVEAAARLGVRSFDSSVGGTGGCNFVPNAQGNIASQQVLAAADALGLRSTIDRVRLDECTRMLEKLLARPLETRYARA
jgi:hydroxymethylglutaryl-CoA lyase